MFCRIYVAKDNLGKHNLLNSLSDFLHMELIDNSYIEKPYCSIEVRKNDDFDEVKLKKFPDGFLYFPFCIEIDIDENINVNVIANDVSSILTFLWTNNYAAVASCDFENLLPENGGYKSRNIPWVE